MPLYTQILEKIYVSCSSCHVNARYITGHILLNICLHIADKEGIQLFLAQKILSATPTPLKNWKIMGKNLALNLNFDYLWSANENADLDSG